MINTIKKNERFHLIYLEKDYFCFFKGSLPTSPAPSLPLTARSPLSVTGVTNLDVQQIQGSIQQTKDSTKFSKIPSLNFNPKDLQIFIYLGGGNKFGNYNAILFNSSLDLPLGVLGNEETENSLRERLPKIIEKYNLPKNIQIHSIESPKANNDYGVLSQHFMSGSLPMPKSFNKQFVDGDYIQFKDNKFFLKEKGSSSFEAQTRSVTDKQSFLGINFFPLKQVPLEQISLRVPYALKIGADGKPSLVMHNPEGEILQSIDLPTGAEIGFTSSGAPLLKTDGQAKEVSTLFNANEVSQLEPAQKKTEPIGDKSKFEKRIIKFGEIVEIDKDGKIWILTSDGEREEVKPGTVIEITTNTNIVIDENGKIFTADKKGLGFQQIKTTPGNPITFDPKEMAKWEKMMGGGKDRLALVGKTAAQIVEERLKQLNRKISDGLKWLQKSSHDQEHGTQKVKASLIDAEARNKSPSSQSSSQNKVKNTEATDSSNNRNNNKKLYFTPNNRLIKLIIKPPKGKQSHEIIEIIRGLILGTHIDSDYQGEDLEVIETIKQLILKSSEREENTAIKSILEQTINNSSTDILVPYIRINLSNLNLHKANLSKANLQGVNLQGANLSEANLSETNLQGANLNGSNLQKANLEKADLKGANLDNAGLSKANINKTDFQGSSLINTNLSDTNIQINQFQRGGPIRDFLLNQSRTK